MSNRIVGCSPIYKNGVIGQVLIYDGYSKASGELRKYPSLSVFTIIQKEKENYILQDSNGNEIRTFHFTSFDCQSLYDAQEWARHQTSQVELLMSILQTQGVKIVSKEQADILGIADTE